MKDFVLQNFGFAIITACLALLVCWQRDHMYEINDHYFSYDSFQYCWTFILLSIFIPINSPPSLKTCFLTGLDAEPFISEILSISGLPLCIVVYISCCIIIETIFW